MRSSSKFLLPLLLTTCLLLSGCYQAKVTTQKEPSNKVVQESFASSFIYGIVPAKVDVSDECPNGIASAERKFSFVNMVVNTITLGIYLPQNVTVTCAAGGGMAASEQASKTTTGRFTLSKDATKAEIRKVLDAAAVQSSLTQAPAQVRITSGK